MAVSVGQFEMIPGVKYPVTIAQIKEIIKTLYRSGPEKAPAIFIWGKMGVGKSSSVRQCAHELGIEFIDLRLSQLDPTDLRGLPSIATGEVKWVPPSFLPRFGKGILFLDELNLAPPAVQAAGYELLLDRRVGEYELPEGWMIVAAGNQEELSPYIYEMAPPLANRMVHLVVKLDLDIWKEWAYRAGIDTSIIAFLTKNPQYLFYYDPTKPVKAYPTPRSWEFVSRILGSGLVGAELEAAVFGTIGQAVGIEFLTFRRLQEEMPDPLKVIRGEEKPIITGKPDVMYLLITSCVAWIPRLPPEISVQKAVDNLIDYANYLYKYGKEQGRTEFVATSVVLIRDMVDAGFDDYLIKSEKMEECVETGPCSETLKTFKKVG